MTERDVRRGLPLPSEDTGDLTQTPPRGDTEDFLVAREEGVPYVPPNERVLSGVRDHEAGPDAAGAPDDDELALRQESGADLSARCLAALRESDVPAGDRISLQVDGSTVAVYGELESLQVADEIAGILGDVEGVDEVVDRTTLPGV